MEKHKRPGTASLIVFLTVALFVSDAQSATAAEELKLIIAPRSTLLTAEGNVILDAYLYNDSDKRRTAPAPEALFDIVWTLRDALGSRPERRGSHFSIGTDTVKKYVINSRETVGCVLTAHFESEPGDLLEFHISVDTKLKTGEVKTIQSNSIMMYRPKENEPASSPKSAITPQGKN
jgi:hypothetical protein